MHEYVRESNAILSKYDAISAGELSATQDPAVVLDYISRSRNELTMVFQFDIVDLGQDSHAEYDMTPPNYSFQQFKDAVRRTQDLIQGTDGWTSVFTENHDQGRSVSRFSSALNKWNRHRAAMHLIQLAVTAH